MIWFSCKQCGKTHHRLESASGSMLFCTCGHGNTVPWESTAPAEPLPELAPVVLPTGPTLEPVKFEVVPVPVDEDDRDSRRRRPLPPRRDGERRPAKVRRQRDERDCFNHESVLKQEKCADCGEGFCKECLVYVQATPLCGPCKNHRVRAMHKPGTTSQLALVSLLLGLFTSPMAFCLYPMGLTHGTPGISLLALIPQALALALGIFALRKTERDPELGGQALAISGIMTATFAAFWTVFLAVFGGRLIV